MEARASTSHRRLAAIAAGIAALVLAIWLAGVRDGDANSLRTATPATADPASPATATVPNAPPREPAAQPAAEAAPAPAPATPSFPFELIVDERDEWSLPVAPDRPCFSPANASPLGYADGGVREGNEVHYRWLGPRPSGELVFGCGLLRRFTLHGGTPLRTSVGPALGPPTPSDAAPVDAPELDVGFALFAGFGAHLAPLAPFLAVGNCTTGGHFGIAPSVPRKPRNQGTLTGRVNWPPGEVATAFVVRIPGTRTAAKTQPDGSFAFAPMPPGDYEIEAGTREGSTARERVKLGESTTHVAVQLTAGTAVRGRVVDAHGNGLADVRLVWRTELGDYNDRAVTRADGTFVVPTHTSSAGLLWACVPGAGARWPVTHASVRSDASDVVLQLSPGLCRGRVRVTVPAGPFVVRLTEVGTGFGMNLVCVHRTEDTSEFAAIDLPTGHYALELCAAEFGVVPGGTFFCDGSAEIVLPPVVLPTLCNVTVALPEGTREPSAFDFVRVGCEFPSRIHTTLGIGATHVLGPGDYELWWRHDRAAAAHSLAFTIARDQRELALTLR